MNPVDVRLRADWIIGVGYRYDVLLDGEIIVSRSRDPEYDAARVLHTRGLRGKFRTIDFKTGKARMILDIEKAARLKTVERDRGGLTVELHRPMSHADRTRLHPPSLPQGRPFGVACAPEAAHPATAVGGKTAAAPSLSLTEGDLEPFPEDA